MFRSYLQPFTFNEYVVKDFFSPVSEITAFSSSEELIMASFDASSLFVNIPLDEAMDLCTDLVFDDADILHCRDCWLDRPFRHLGPFKYFPHLGPY